MSNTSKKTKPSTQKGAFASIFRRANQREVSKASPNRQKASVAAKVSTKSGSFTGVIVYHCRKLTQGGEDGSSLPAYGSSLVENVK